MYIENIISMGTMHARDVILPVTLDCIQRCAYNDLQTDITPSMEFNHIAVFRPILDRQVIPEMPYVYYYKGALTRGLFGYTL